MKEAVIVHARRTAIGNFGGQFKNVSAVDLATKLVQNAMNELQLRSDEIDEVILGNVLSAGLGQNISRQVAIDSGIDQHTPAYSINMVCGSGLKAIQLAAQSIVSDEHDIIIAGGTENMSQAPYLSPQTRFGSKMGDVKLVDSVIRDGLSDAFSGIHMGITAENIAKKYNISREEQDAFSLKSQNKAKIAWDSNKFEDEIVPISVSDRKGKEIVIEKDEFIKPHSTIESLSALKPVFLKDGTVTAGNASGINDGAAIVVLMSRERAQELGLEVLVTIKGFNSYGVDPKTMGEGPIYSTNKLLDKLNLTVNDIDLVESNEAFASQAIAVIKELNLNDNIVNVNGGAIALGHPIGASGARILVSLIHELRRQNLKRGLATLCVGGGMGISVIVEN